MTKHRKIQERLRKEYTAKGYKVEVKEAVGAYGGKWWVIDVIARKGKESIAIAIGLTNSKKLNFLKTKFSKVIHIPYLKKSSDGYLTHTLCNYTWEPRVTFPKECPNCKGRLVSEYIN